MPPDSAAKPLTLSDFFAASERRSDCWAKLSVTARAWAAAGGRGQATTALAAEASALLDEIAPLEEFWAYPGLRLMSALREQRAASDAGGVAKLAREINA